MIYGACTCTALFSVSVGWILRDNSKHAGIYISACQAGGVGKALTVHASTCLQLPPQLLSTMRLSNRQTRSKWGSPLKIPPSIHFSPLFCWFSFGWRGL
jgi:hypothetical protein